MDSHRTPARIVLTPSEFYRWENDEGEIEVVQFRHRTDSHAVIYLEDNRLLCVPAAELLSLSPDGESKMSEGKKPQVKLLHTDVTKLTAAICANRDSVSNNATSQTLTTFARGVIGKDVKWPTVKPIVEALGIEYKLVRGTNDGSAAAERHSTTRLHNEAMIHVAKFIRSLDEAAFPAELLEKLEQRAK